jgi:replicative DNA helicase
MSQENLGWEAAVMGTVLCDPEAMEVACELAPIDFSRSHKVIWNAILDLYRRNVLETRALIELLRSSEDLDLVGSDVGNPQITGEEYIVSLLHYNGNEISEYTRQVIEASTRKQLREVAALIAADVLTSNLDADELLDEAERRVMALRKTRNIAGATLGDILRTFMPTLEGQRTGEIQPAWTPTLTGVRSIIGYVDQSDFVLIAGRPGSGKSAYLRFEAYHTARADIPILTFNLENSEADYARGAIALHTGIDSRSIREPRLLTNAQLERVRRAASELAGLPWDIVSLGSPSVAEIERIARAKMKTLEPKIIQIDYIQLINNGIVNKVADVTLTSQTVKGWTMPNQFNIPIMAAAQLSRSIENRGPSALPQLSDLRESGSLEQDSTMVLFPRKVWGETPTHEQRRRFPENLQEDGTPMAALRVIPVRFHVLKNRNGPTGTTDVIKWSMHTGNYQTMERGHSWD